MLHSVAECGCQALLTAHEPSLTCSCGHEHCDSQEPGKCQNRPPSSGERVSLPFGVPTAMLLTLLSPMQVSCKAGT